MDLYRRQWRLFANKIKVICEVIGCFFFLNIVLDFRYSLGFTVLTFWSFPWMLITPIVNSPQSWVMFLSLHRTHQVTGVFVLFVFLAWTSLSGMVTQRSQWHTVGQWGFWYYLRLLFVLWFWAPGPFDLWPSQHQCELQMSEHPGLVGGGVWSKYYFYFIPYTIQLLFPYSVSVLCSLFALWHHDTFLEY